MLASGSNDEGEKFTYLRSIICTTRGTDQDVEARLGKTTSIFRAMEIKRHRRATNVKIFNSNVKAVLIYVRIRVQHEESHAEHKSSSTNVKEELWIYTDETESSTMRYGRKLISSQYCTSPCETLQEVNLAAFYKQSDTHVSGKYAPTDLQSKSNLHRSLTVSLSATVLWRELWWSCWSRPHFYALETRVTCRCGHVAVGCW